MSRSLDDLTPEFRPIAEKFLAKLTEAGIPVMIIDTLRTPEEQEENIRKGVSWTRNSKHLPQPPSGKSNAMDICPFKVFALYGPDKLQWDERDPVWEKIGKIAESIPGIKWAVTTVNGKKKDLGHVEFHKQ